MESTEIKHRPKTRGELLNCLKNNIECEVVSSNVEITNIFLDYWLNFKGQYTTTASENIGWTIYRHI